MSIPQSLKPLIKIVQLFNPELSKHSSSVAYLAAGLATKLGNKETEIQALWLAGFFHDFGKIAMMEIINAVLPLSDAEFLRVRAHPVLGYEALKEVDDLPELVMEAVLHHHENWDGSGYPSGLSGEAIPWAARLLAVCDAYDAMVSSRPYRIAVSSYEALAELRSCAGTQFDPRFVGPFCVYIENVITKMDYLGRKQKSEERVGLLG